MRTESTETRKQGRIEMEQLKQGKMTDSQRVPWMDEN